MSEIPQQDDWIWDTALDSCDLTAIALLLEQGANPNLPDYQGFPLIHSVIQLRDSSTKAELLEMLIQAGADVNLPNEYGDSPLDFAYQIGSSVAVRTLLRSGAHLVKIAYTSGAELSLAVLSENNFEAVDALLSRGIDINARDENNRTALHTAALSGDDAMVTYLLERGADPNARETAMDNKETVYPQAGRMPLHIAVDSAYPDVVKALLAAGAEVNAGNGPDAEWTPLICAAFAAGWPEKRPQIHQIMRLLIEQGADVRATSPSERSTALSIAAWIAYPEDVALLLEFGAGASSEDLLNAMYSTTGDNGYRNLPVLWAAGRKLNPPLLFKDVISCTNSTAISTLLGRFELHPVISPVDSAALNEADPETGETPLIWLVRNLGIKPAVELEFAFLEEDVSLLLDCGADPLPKDKEGYSALDIARERGLTNVINRLEQSENSVK